jgi:molecular chaperone GrpE
MTKRNATEKDTEAQGLQEECADTANAETSVIMGDASDNANADQADADEDTVNADDPLAQMTAERDRLKEQLLRALADAENMRRRSEREAASVRKYGHTPFARDLVGALDNLGRAVDSTPEDIDSLDEVIKSLITGIKLSWTELQSVIKKHGIEQVTPKGEKFDYNLHQAMFEVPTDEVPSGTVVEVVQHGYVLHDRLLRPAMVGVSKASTTQALGGDEKKQD